ncbi:MAG: HmuY family protein [Capnocytophaga sp.]|nr:HmuY family protein [Capnocytophaga sp.]
MKKLVFLSVALLSFAFTSCSKEETTPTPTDGNVKEFKNLQLFSDNWTYFSFDQGTAIKVANPTESTDWDIAFYYYYVKTNGGTSGKGNGGLFKTESKDFAAITEVPSGATFAKDTLGTMTIGSYPNLVTKDDSFSKVMSGAFGKPEEVSGYVAFSPANMPTWPSVFAPTKWVYIVKTASGSYAKIQVTDVYNDSAKALFPTFQYQVSQDGKF